MKPILLLLLIPVMSMMPAKLPVLEWQLIAETTWDQKTDETNNASIWTPSVFSPNLISLEGKQISISGYVSEDENGNMIITRARRSSASLKDRTASPPDYIVLQDLGSGTYAAPLKKYEVTGILDLNGDNPDQPPFILKTAQILRPWD